MRHLMNVRQNGRERRVDQESQGPGQFPGLGLTMHVDGEVSCRYRGSSPEDFDHA
jgi:hypothetical protein